MNTFLTIWACWVAFGLPIKLGAKVMAAVRDSSKSRSWRAGKAMFFGGILIWSPYALIRKLLGIPVSVRPFLAIHFVLMYGGLLVQWRANRAMTGPMQKNGPPPAPGGADGGPIAS